LPDYQATASVELQIILSFMTYPKALGKNTTPSYKSRYTFSKSIMVGRKWMCKFLFLVVLALGAVIFTIEQDALLSTLANINNNEVSIWNVANEWGIRDPLEPENDERVTHEAASRAEIVAAADAKSSERSDAELRSKHDDKATQTIVARQNEKERVEKETKAKEVARKNTEKDGGKQLTDAEKIKKRRHENKNAAELAKKVVQDDDLWKQQEAANKKEDTQRVEKETKRRKRKGDANLEIKRPETSPEQDSTDKTVTSATPKSSPKKDKYGSGETEKASAKDDKVVATNAQATLGNGIPIDTTSIRTSPITSSVPEALATKNSEGLKGEDVEKQGQHQEVAKDDHKRRKNRKAEIAKASANNSKVVASMESANATNAPAELSFTHNTSTPTPTNTSSVQEALAIENTDDPKGEELEKQGQHQEIAKDDRKTRRNRKAEIAKASANNDKVVATMENSTTTNAPAKMSLTDTTSVRIPPNTSSVPEALATKNSEGLKGEDVEKQGQHQEIAKDDHKTRRNYKAEIAKASANNDKVVASMESANATNAPAKMSLTDTTSTSTPPNTSSVPEAPAIKNSEGLKGEDVEKQGQRQEIAKDDRKTRRNRKAEIAKASANNDKTPPNTSSVPEAPVIKNSEGLIGEDVEKQGQRQENAKDDRKTRRNRKAEIAKASANNDKVVATTEDNAQDNGEMRQEHKKRMLRDASNKKGNTEVKSEQGVSKAINDIANREN
jgi:hypothetical protein